MTFIRRTLAGLLVAIGGTVVFSGTASAHVTVSAEDATPGHDVTAVFRVPNERDDASTVRLEVRFPTDHPLGQVSVAPVPGWTATVKKRTLAVPVHAHDGEITEVVESVVWQGGAIKPGEFLEFPVTFGPVPHDADRLVFKALQSYSDGQVVRWIETPPSGDAQQPQYPAPVLSLAAGHGAATGTGVDPLARVAGLAGLVTAFGALAGCVLILVPVRRRRATRAPAAAPQRDPVPREKARF
jgi:uncharacterized protein YcnI